MIEIKNNGDYAKEAAILKKWIELEERQSDLKGRIKTLDAKLDDKAYAKYPQLSVDEIKTLVVDDKWLATLAGVIHAEIDRVSQSLAGRIRQLAERYESTLPDLEKAVVNLQSKVSQHLERMGFQL